MTKPYLRVMSARKTDTQIHLILQTSNGGSQFKAWPRDLLDEVLVWIADNVENPIIKWHPTI